MCLGCGYLNAELTLTDRTYVCTTCGMVKNRNLNAAINLEKEAKAEMNDYICLCFAEQVDSYDLQP